MERKLAAYIESSFLRRRVVNVMMCVLLGVAAAAALVPLLSVFSHVASKGAPALTASFFTGLPRPVGEAGGGMANAVVGTLILVFLASAVGIPWGIATGVYLSEYRHSRGVAPIRFCVELLSSVPSIVIGLFVYALLVIPLGRFSALAGGMALGIIMIPTVARSSEELLKMVPTHIREAGLALGLPRWKVTLLIVLKGSMKALATGVMLAVARVAGETAPLLFTALNNSFWPSPIWRLDQPTSSLPVQIYTYSISPYEDWHRLAWAGAFVLVLLVFSLNLLTRLALRSSGRLVE